MPETGGVRRAEGRVLGLFERRAIGPSGPWAWRGRQGTFGSSMGTTAQRETGTALAELRARTALRGAGLDPSVPIERVSSVTNEVWLTPEHAVRVNRRPSNRLYREALVAGALPAEVGYPRVVAHGGGKGEDWLVTERVPGRAARARVAPPHGRGAIPGRGPPGRPTRGAAPHAGASRPASDRERTAAARGGRGQPHRARGGGASSRHAAGSRRHGDARRCGGAGHGPRLHPRAVRSQHARPRRRHLRERALARGPDHRPARRRVGSAGSARPRPRHPAAVRRLPPAARRRRVRGPRPVPRTTPRSRGGWRGRTPPSSSTRGRSTACGCTPSPTTCATSWRHRPRGLRVTFPPSTPTTG